MKVVFRVDSSTVIGAGHLMRCLTLAEALRERDVQVGFVCREHPGNLIELLRKKNMPVTVLPAPAAKSAKSDNESGSWLGVAPALDAAQTIDALNGDKPDWLVVDHYGLDGNWEQKLRSLGARLMVIDDLASRLHECDVLLDQNYSVDSAQRYKTLVPPTCQVLLGPHYALLRKAFQAQRQHQSTRSNQLKKILVFFTLGDDQGETIKAMKGVELFGEIECVDVVVGSANSDNIAIKEMCAARHWGYHCQVDYMPTLIAQADLVIGSGGSSNWERCALGVPALVVILAENQAAIAQNLECAGVVINLGWNTCLQAADYEKALKGMTSQRLASLSEQSFKLVDAKGAQRVAEILTNGQLNLRLKEDGNS